MLSLLVEQHTRVHSALKVETEQWYVTDLMHIAGYEQRALIYDLVTQFANRYVRCWVDTWSILYGILAVQTRLSAQCDTSSGL